jgi:DNA ligase-1
MALFYAQVAACYDSLEKTSGRIKTAEILAGLLKRAPREDLEKLVYLTQGRLRPDWEGMELGIAERLLVRALANATGLSENDVGKVLVETGDVGSAASRLLENGIQQTLFAQPLTLDRVYAGLMKIASTSGAGSIEDKLKTLASILGDATPAEAKYIVRTVMGVLRLGVADFTILDAASIAFTGGRDARPRLEKAYNVYPDLGHIIRVLADGGVASLDKIRLTVGVPVRPMLAERLPTASEIVKKLGDKEVAAEYKLDGERLQIHKNGDKVDLFSRRLEVVTKTYPDVVNVVKSNIKAESCIVEAEVVAMDKETGHYLPFQELMHRRRKHGIDDAVKQYPVSLNLFDVLLVNGVDYTSRSYLERRAMLEQVVSSNENVRLMPALRTSDPAAIEDYLHESLENGGEGLMVKSVDGQYQAGARGYLWVKLKREYDESTMTDTLDLVVIGGLNGQGKRSGLYGALLLGAYDKDRDVFASVSKIGTGFSDDDLKTFYDLLQPLKSEQKPANVDSTITPDVWFKPVVVVEVIASEISLSPIHRAGWNKVREGAGLALRFPKFTGKIRTDKNAQDASTVDEVIQMLSNQAKKHLEFNLKLPLESGIPRR